MTSPIPVRRPNASTMWSYTSYSSSPSPSPSYIPPPPPPSPSDSLYDITPRKTSFSMVASSRSSSCAFPSWPNRSSLYSDSEGSSGASSYLSDEDLFFPDPVTSSSSSSSPHSTSTSLSTSPDEALCDDDLTTEQQIQLDRARAEDAAQRQFLAHAQLRAQQAQLAQLQLQAANEQKRRKRRVVVGDKKRRSGSSGRRVVA